MLFRLRNVTQTKSDQRSGDAEEDSERRKSQPSKHSGGDNLMLKNASVAGHKNGIQVSMLTGMLLRNTSSATRNRNEDRSPRLSVNGISVTRHSLRFAVPGMCQAGYQEFRSTSVQFLQRSFPTQLLSWRHYCGTIDERCKRLNGYFCHIDFQG